MTECEKKLEDELRAVYEALTNAQHRSNELLEECRTLKREKERLKTAVMRLIMSSETIVAVPGYLAHKHDIADEERPNGEPQGIDQRQEGYEPPPPERRAHNSILGKKQYG